MATEDVREVQEILRALAIDRGDQSEIAVDGVYGAETSLAVSLFQREVGLPVTGRVDFATWEALNDAYAALGAAQRPPERVAALGCNVRLRSGTVGDEVYILQVMLNAIEGRHGGIGAVPINGVYGEETQGAVRRYQQAAGLNMTGETDKETWNAVTKVYNKFFEQVCS